MAENDPAPRRLQEVEHPPGAAGLGDAVRSVRGRIPTSVTALAFTLVGLIVVDAVGVRLPGRGYVRNVAGDPTVFLFVRLAVIVGLVAVTLLGAWFALSVAAHIKHRLWVRHPGGFEPQVLHRTASEIEEGVEDIHLVLDETKETNVELSMALELANARMRDLEREIERLERELDDGHQLSLGSDD